MLSDHKEAAAIEGVLFLLVRDGLILMERCPKKAARHGGEWFIPGGRIEAGECANDALLREMREELGVRPRVMKAMPLVDAVGEGWPGSFLMRPYLIEEWCGTVPEHFLDHPDVPVQWVPITHAANSPSRVVRSVVELHKQMRK